MIEFLSGLNWVGGLAGAVIAWLIGALWYSPKLFGGAWLRYQNRAMGDLGSPLPAMVVSVVFHLVMAVLIMVLAHYAQPPHHGYWMTIGLLMLAAALSKLQGAMYEGRPLGLWGITAGHEFAVILVIAGFVAYLR